MRLKTFIESKNLDDLSAEELERNISTIKKYRDNLPKNGARTYKDENDAIARHEKALAKKKKTIKEAFIGFFPAVDGMGTKIRAALYKNPTRKELNLVHNSYSVTGGDVPGMVDDQGNFYIWSPYMLHYKANESGKIPQGCIGVRIYYDAQECHVYVTDWTKRSKWNHNPDIAQFLQNSYLGQLWQITDISYYDGDIVGDWSDLDSEDNNEA